jgi:hypothetical protein
VGVTPTQLHDGLEGKLRQHLVSSTNPSYFLDLFLYLSFFFSRSEGGGEKVGDHVGACRLNKSDRQLYSPVV